jgi:hypothetical protein
MRQPREPRTRQLDAGENLTQRSDEALPVIGSRRGRSPGDLRSLLLAWCTRGERSKTVFGMPSLPYPMREADRRPFGTS